MTDPYAKTLVIRDPDYRPGEIGPSPTPTTKKTDADLPETPATAYPDYDDTGWLT